MTTEIDGQGRQLPDKIDIFVKLRCLRVLSGHKKNVTTHSYVRCQDTPDGDD